MYWQRLQREWEIKKKKNIQKSDTVKGRKWDFAALLHLCHKLEI
jgi:hypothetical protein